MLSYTWNLAAEQPSQPKTLSTIQYILASLSIFIDVRFEDDKVVLTITVPDQLDPSSLGTLSKSTDDLLATDAPPPDSGPANRGRPVKPPGNDITLGQVYKMQSDGVKADDIAVVIGVSRRTFYRKLKAAKQSGLDPTVPYSKWEQGAEN